VETGNSGRPILTQAPRAGHVNFTVISFRWIDWERETQLCTLHYTTEEGDGRGKTENGKRKTEEEEEEWRGAFPFFFFFFFFPEPSSCHMCRCISTCSNSEPKAFAVQCNASQAQAQVRSRSGNYIACRESTKTPPAFPPVPSVRHTRHTRHMLLSRLDCETRHETRFVPLVATEPSTLCLCPTDSCVFFIYFSSSSYCYRFFLVL
jgi:hypothetical protein